MTDSGKVRREIFALFLFLLVVLTGLSLISYTPSDPSLFSTGSGKVHNYAGLIGSYLSSLLFQFFGYGAWLLLLLMIYFLFVLFSSTSGEGMVRTLLGLVVILFTIPPIIHLIFKTPLTAPFYTGGVLGKFEGELLRKIFGEAGVFVVLFGVLIIAIVYATGLSFLHLLATAGKKILELFKYSEEQVENDYEEKVEELDEDSVEKDKIFGELTHTGEFSPPPDMEDVKSSEESEVTGTTDDRPFTLGDTGTFSSEPSFTLGEREEISGSVEESESENFAGLDMSARNSESFQDLESGEEENIKIYEVEQEVKKKPGGRKRSGGLREESYKFPTTDLLIPPDEDSVEIEEEKLKEKAVKLKEKLAEFRVEGKVVGILPGPIITRYEFVPAPGIKVSQVTNLADDLAMAVKARKVRISVISEKGVLGIEIPNEYRRIVRLREILESRAYLNKKLKLPLVLGLDIAGTPVVEDLVDMPHILVAGMTGSGKSVGINSILVGLLYRHSPKNLRLVLVDPKLVELSIYSDIPHLLVPVISESDRAVGVLKGIVGEMERRYSMLRLMKVRNIEEYNAKFSEMAGSEEILCVKPDNELFQPPGIEFDEEGRACLSYLPYIVVVIDEYSDLMFATGKKVEEFVARLAQKARAAGIHIILATQRPSAKVVTGIIKANLPARIAYNVRSATDSRIILDDPGASQLLGKGDMLFLHPSRNEIKRIQGPLVTLEEVKKVVEFWKRQGTPAYRDDLIILDEDSSDGRYENVDKFKDKMYYRALKIAMEEGEVSASRLQRRLGIGYNRAARYIEIMEAEGIISKADGAKPRKVLKFFDVNLED